MQHPSRVTPWFLLAALTGCAATDPTRPTWSTSSTVLGASDSRPAWTLRKLGGDGFDSIAAVAAMPDGGLVIAGHFEGTIDVGSDRLVSAGHTDAFIARLDPAGQVDWAERLGGAGFDAATAVVVDRDGKPVVVGELSGTARAGAFRLRARGRSDLFAVSFGADSSVQWAVAFGESDWDAAASAAVTADGSIAVVGSSGRDERDDDRARADDSDVLVALVGPGGNLRWTRTFGGTEWDQGFAVAAHPDGDIEVAGSFGGAMELGASRLVSAGVTDGFTARLSPAGRIGRTRGIGGKGADAVTALAVWKDGATALAGHFNGSMSFGATPLVSHGATHVFVARSDAGGEPSWAVDVGAGEAHALGALPDGSLLLAGSYSIDLELVAGDPSEVILHRIATSGHPRALVRLSGSLVNARGLAVTGDGDAAVVGSFVREAHLGARTVEAEDKLDGYLMTTRLGTWGD
jgi:hypothetical protein